MKPEIQKLLWRSRRGMLELATLFRQYLLAYGEQMNQKELQDFESLLELQDQTLFEAFSGKRKLDDMQHQQLFDMIKRTLLGGPGEGVGRAISKPL